MSNQATADLEDAPHLDAGQADAGAGHGGDWEGRASESSSANTDHADYADDPSSAGSGQAAGADEQDDTSNVTDIEAYWATVDKLDLDSMPLDVEEAPTGEEDPPSDPVSEEPALEEEEEEEPSGKAPQFRLRPKSDLESRTFALMKADPSLDLEAAVSLARASLGLAAAPAAEPGEAPVEEPAAEPEGESVAEIEAAIRAQRLAVIEATEGLDMDQVAAGQRELLALEDRLAEARTREAERRQQTEEREAAWKAEARANWAKAAAEYPDLNDPDSAFTQRLVEIDEIWEEVRDPRWIRADKSLLIADRVAKEFGIKPASAQAAPPTPVKGQSRTLPVPASSRPSTPATRPGPAAVRPASGSARTAADTPSQLEAALGKVETLEDYDALVAAHFR